MDANSSVRQEGEKLLEIVHVLHKRVEEFKEALMPEYINLSREKEAQKTAADVICRMEALRTNLEKWLDESDDETVTRYIKTILSTVSDKSSADMVKYQRAVMIFKRREEEYYNMSPLARQFLTPRTRFSKAWEKEEELGRSAHPESNFLFIVVTVFTILLILALIMTTNGPEKILGIMQRTFSGKITSLVHSREAANFSANHISGNLTKTEL